MDDRSVRLLIADDEPLAAERLQLLLAQCADVDLVGTASDGEGAVRMADALTPDLLLLDIEMPGLDGIDVAARSPPGSRRRLSYSSPLSTSSRSQRSRWKPSTI